MAKKKYEEANIQAIADAIREKTGTDNTYDTSDMADGVNEVYEAGNKNGYDEASLAHWNAITRNGERTAWNGADGYSPFNLTDYSEVKLPKPIIITGKADKLFRLYKGNKLPRKEDIDMSGVTSVFGTFSYIYGVECRTIPDYGIPVLESYDSTYAYAQEAYTIEVIRCNENTNFNSTFSSCGNLKNVTFEGTIGQNISFAQSPLTVESIKNIITHLKDYSADTTNQFKYTLTLSSKRWTNLEAEGETAEYTDAEGNTTTMTWLALVEAKGWNRA